MSLALATKGVLPDFTGTGTGTGPSTTIYVLENFDVEMVHESLDIEVTILDDILFDIGEIAIEVDVEETETAAVETTFSDVIDIEVDMNGIMVQQSFSLWDDDDIIPSNVTDETDHVNLGVKFKSAVNGYVTAIRFYKHVINTSLHTGSLWTDAGVHLRSVIFIDETASGWQEMSFVSPILIEANILYIASYHTQGYYSYDFNYFISTYENRFLSAPANDEVNGNGVFTYDSGIAFPTSSFNQGNYWIDIKFIKQ